MSHDPGGALAQAVERLRQALLEPETPLHRDGTIQRFEFSFELAWKALQKHLRSEGLDCASPRSCLRLAWRQRLLEDEEAWLAMLEDRNRTSHTYDEALAIEVYRRLPGHLETLSALSEALHLAQAD